MRKKEYLFSPEVLEMERELAAALGTRVAIEPKEKGGKLAIDYMSEEDLRTLFATLQARVHGLNPEPENVNRATGHESASPKEREEHLPAQDASQTDAPQVDDGAPVDDRGDEEKKVDENTFSPSSFSI